MSKEFNKFNNLEMQVPLFKKRTKKGSYNIDNVMGFLETIPFSSIELPLYSYNSVIYKDIDKMGKQAVGYISGYNAEEGVFDVVIYERFRGRIEKLDDLVIFPRTKKVQDAVVRLIGLDICPALYYANIR